METKTAEGVKVKAAVMFADLKGCAQLYETAEPDRVAKIISKYLAIAEKAVADNGGVLDKYLGDAVMAYWVDEKGLGEAAADAANAAIDIRNAMALIEDDVFEELSIELFYGIGLNYGNAILCSIGSGEKKEKSLIGDTVNVAARIENNTPKNRIYTTKKFCDAIGNAFICKEEEQGLRVKDKDSLIRVFEVIDRVPDKGSRIAGLVHPAGNEKGNQRLYICGSRGSYSVSGARYDQFGGQTSCYVVKDGDYAIVVDCGTGLANARPIIKNCKKIDVLLTHMHYDHCIGLLEWSVFPKTAELTFYGNFGAWNGADSISDFFRKPYWPVDLSTGTLVDISGNDENIHLAHGFEARFIDAPHPNGAKRIFIDTGSSYIFFMGDNENDDDLPGEYYNKIDYLIYDGMYDDTEYDQHIGWGHSTWQGGTRLAKKSHARNLIISHHDARCSDVILLDRERRAKNYFPATVFARIGDSFDL